MKERIHWIDIAKGICILSVIAGHLSDETVNSIVYSYHLTVFFLLSGYTLRKEKVDAEYCRKKFVRLLVPYFLTCACIMAMNIVNSILLTRDTSVQTITSLISRDILYAFFASGSTKVFGAIEIGGRIGAIWFLPAMFFALIFVQLILQHFSDRRRQFICCIGIALLGYVTGRFIWLPFSIQSGAFALPFIWIGYQAKQEDWLSKIKTKHLLVCVCGYIAAIVFDVASLSFVNAKADDLLISAIVGLMSSCIIIMLSKEIGHCAPLEFYGRNSIYVLCIHLFELNTLGGWYSKFYAWTGITKTTLVRFLLKVCVITALTVLVLGLKKLSSRAANGGMLPFRQKKNGTKTEITDGGRDRFADGGYAVASGRDNSIDVAKGILIVLMLIGHYGSLDSNFRAGIYSFHMIAFVLLSGYFFHPESCENLTVSVKKLVKSFLLPYAVFGVIYIWITHDGFATELKRVLFGISYTQNWFTDVKSIGPVYFILLLFLTRLIYLCLARYLEGRYLSAAVLLLSLGGYYLGKFGYWLPWSLDCALYCLIFYHIGYLLKKYDLLKRITEWYPSYFILSCLWIYMIYSGSMELAVRDYGSYGITLTGAVSATLLLVMLSKVLCNVLPAFLTLLMGRVGQATLYILIIHKLFQSNISTWISQFLTKGYVWHMILYVAVPVFAGMICGLLIQKFKHTARSWVKK